MSNSLSIDAFAGRPQIQVSPVVWAWQICAIVSMLVFTSFSSLDITFSRLFFNVDRFPMAHLYIYKALRQIIWIATILVALGCLIGFAMGLLRRRFLRIPFRKWSFATSLMVIGPWLVVNEGLKQFWGRARPADILEFGGSMIFSPALVPSDQCAKNCSFVSGEGSGAVTLGVVAWVLTTQISNCKLRKALRLIAIVAAFIGSFLRVATGRHFLSDIVFAALIVTGIALLLRPMLSRSRSQNVQ